MGVQALKEHQRFEPRLFQKDEVVVIFEAGQSRRKAKEGFALIFKLAKNPCLNVRHSGMFGLSNLNAFLRVQCAGFC